MPLPGTRVIPDDWSAHHRPTAEGGMTAQGVITANGTINRDGTYTPGPQRYAGPMAVEPLSSIGRTAVTQGGQVTVRAYRVSVPWNVTGVQVGDDVQVTASADPQLVGMRLRVIDVEAASEQWQRDLTCEEVESGG